MTVRQWPSFMEGRDIYELKNVMALLSNLPISFFLISLRYILFLFLVENVTITFACFPPRVVVLRTSFLNGRGK